MAAQLTFKAEKADGVVDLTFEFDASALEGKSVVAFEDLYKEDRLIASHSDLSDKDQTIEYPKIATELKDKATDSHTALAAEKMELTDTVTYTNLEAGRKYLTNALKEQENLTDRQTDRQTIPHAYAIADLLGIDRRKNKGRAEYQSLKTGNIPSIPFDEKYENGMPVRLLMLYGKMPHKEKGKLTNEFSQRYDRSKYKFFLDAPFEISSKCCNVMKKNPAKKYQKETGKVPITAQMASESRLRTEKWLQNSCNAFDNKYPISNPMSFWTENDVVQ